MPIHNDQSPFPHGSEWTVMKSSERLQPLEFPEIRIFTLIICYDEYYLLRQNQCLDNSIITHYLFCMNLAVPHDVLCKRSWIPVIIVIFYHLDITFGIAVHGVAYHKIVNYAWLGLKERVIVLCWDPSNNIDLDRTSSQSDNSNLLLMQRWFHERIMSKMLCLRSRGHAYRDCQKWCRNNRDSALWQVHRLDQIFLNDTNVCVCRSTASYCSNQ